MNNQELNQVSKGLKQMCRSLVSKSWVDSADLIKEAEEAEAFLDKLDDLLHRMDEACDINEPGHDRAQELANQIDHHFSKGERTYHDLWVDEDTDDGVRKISVYYSQFNDIAFFNDYIDAAYALEDVSKYLVGMTIKEVIAFLKQHPLALKE